MTSKRQSSSSSSSSSALYGIQRPKQSASQKDLTSSSTLAFTTHLSSLISKDAAASSTSQSSSSSRGRTRPSKGSKPDIFAVHNKGALKRAAADEAEDVHGVRQQQHQNSDAVGQVDAATLQRSKRRMEEKAHIYEDLKKGYHLAEGESSDDGDVAEESKMRRRERNALVDFDRKWAEQEHNDDDGDDDENSEDETGSMVDYEDEFGRTRHGTKAEAAQAARARRQQLNINNSTEEKDTSRPSRPSNLIHGETIQSQAFNPDAAMASQMASLAARRDRSATPPSQTHYDAEAEVRTRGTGFYKFSADEKTREKEMEELLSTRRETEREREVRCERKAERDRLKDERKKKVQELRSRHHAERFLEGLSVDLG